MKESEIAVLGSMLVDPSATNDVSGILASEHFSIGANGRLFGLIKRMKSEGKPIDVITVSGEIKNELDEVGGRKYLFDIASLVPSPLHVVHYAKKVRESARLRRVSDLAFMLSKSPDDEAITKKLRDAIADTGLTGNSTIGMGEAITIYRDEIDNRVVGKDKTWRTGFNTLDSMCAGGLRKGQLVTVGARTSRGKSALLLKLALNMSRQGASVLFCSQEMGIPEIMDRAVALNSNLTVGQARRSERGAVSEILEACGKFSGLPIRWGNQKNFSMEHFTAEVERGKPDILVVDYIQRIQVPSRENRAAHFSDVANGLKSLALHTGTVVITASQLSRGIEFRDDNTPTLSDLKESGGIEEASDIVILVHTPEEDQMAGTRRGNFIIAKNRNGATASLPVVFNMGKTEFSEERA